MDSASTLERVLRDDELRLLLRPLGRIARITQLDGGLFASVAFVQLDDGRRLAVKSAPPAGSSTLLSYEASVMDAEIEVLRIGARHPELRLPMLELVDRTRSVVDTDVLVTRFLDGERWDVCGARMTPDALARARYELGLVLAAFAAVEGERFGYVSDRAPRYSSDDWFTTFRTMMADLVVDADAHDVDVDGERVLGAVDRHEQLLSSVRRLSLVHGDLWAGNTFVDPARGRVVGVIDPERALWGDPLSDVAGTDQLTSADPPRDLLRGLRDGGREWHPSTDIATRLNLYRLWFAVAMLAESGPRSHLLGDRDAREAPLRAQASRLLETLA